MKKAMSNVDVSAIEAELQKRLLGGHVGKAYQLNADTIWLSVQSVAEGRLDLLMEAGRRIHLTKKERNASKTPPQFPTMLRNRLSGGRITNFKQFDLDRVIEIVIERAGVSNYLIVELFPKGSMILLDESRHILSMLRKMIYRGRRMAAGEEYLYHTIQLDPRAISRQELSGLLATSEQDLVRTIVRCMNMGGTYGEEVCLQAGLDKNRPAAELDTPDIDRLHKALSDVFMPKTIEPHIVLLDGQPFDVLPAPLKLYEGLERSAFDTFSDALDAFFVDRTVEKETNPIDRRIEIQRQAIEEFRVREREYVLLGELIYQRYGEIESLLKVISDARAKGFSYVQIWERFSASDLPSARMIKSLDHSGEAHIVLDGAELDLNAGLTVPQNAQRYYELAKEMVRKAEGARRALEITQELKSSKQEPKKTRLAFRRRKPKWYERFRWFTTSDGFLVIGGRDADTNEEIYAKYLEKRDLVLHTDAPGAPLTVVKTEGLAVPETTLQEAAVFAVSYSSIWKAGFASGDCYMIKAEQVTKTPEHGEYLRKGAFVIRGERRYFKDTSVGLAIGIDGGLLIGGPTSAVRPRADPVVLIEPGEYNPDDLAKRIYRLFSLSVEERAYLKSIASVDQIVQFLPPGGSRTEEGKAMEP
jgi:predicted ribosome quality control (RQC) complex YloA/Tae2 family protein